MTNSDDRYDQICTMCCAGRYHETSIHDDWDGVLHCTNKECNHEVKRYKWKDNPQPKVEKTVMTDADKVFALTEIMNDVIHTLELKQYDIEDSQLSYDCVIDADKFRQRMIEILYENT